MGAEAGHGQDTVNCSKCKKGMHTAISDFVIAAIGVEQVKRPLMGEES